MALDYDTWLLEGSEPNGPDDYEVGNAVFNMSLRGGVVTVAGSVNRVYGGDEDGRASYLNVKINYIHWSFGDWADVELDYSEREYVENRIKQEVQH